ncbi:MAG: toll/interleukin-1 receptor domain-containing protein [Myxococcaceae bacterium]
METPLKDVFLCHNRADKDWTRALGERLEQEDWSGRKLSVFFDEWDIEPGDNILLKLNHGLKVSRFVAVVLSPEMLGSDWCGLELTSVLAQDPVNRQGRMIPLLRRDQDLTTKQRIEIPPILRPFNYLDFRDEKAFARAYARLLAKIKGEAVPRGRLLGGQRPQPSSAGEGPPMLASFSTARQDPDSVHDTLVSNLLPVCDMPRVIWSAKTTLGTKSDLPPGNDLPPFIIREGKIFTFADLSSASSPFRPWLAGTEWKREALTDWSNNPDRWRWIIELLNLALKAHLHSQGVTFDKETKRYHFRPRKTGKSVQLKWGSGTKRTVVRAPDKEKGGYWVHQGAKFAFETLGSRLFLSVEPCWVFTTDGYKSIRKQDIGPLAMQWGGKERNGAIVRHVLMWSDVLTKGHRTGHLETGDKPVVIGRLPATVGMGVGIADDQVTIHALLKFTSAEQELEVPEEIVFGYIDEPGAEGEDDDEDAAA